MRQPMNRPQSEVTATVSALMVRSERVRPRITAIGGMGSERKRSTMPRSRSFARPSAVKAALKVTARAKMPPIRYVR